MDFIVHIDLSHIFGIAFVLFIGMMFFLVVSADPPSWGKRSGPKRSRLLPD